MLKLLVDDIRALLGRSKIPMKRLAEVGGAPLHYQTIREILNEDTEDPGLSTVGRLFDSINAARREQGLPRISALDYLQEG